MTFRGNIRHWIDTISTARMHRKQVRISVVFDFIPRTLTQNGTQQRNIQHPRAGGDAGEGEAIKN